MIDEMDEIMETDENVMNNSDKTEQIPIQLSDKPDEVKLDETSTNTTTNNNLIKSATQLQDTEENKSENEILSLEDEDLSVKKVRNKRLQIIDSDSESEENGINLVENDEEITEKKSRLLQLCDSDSETENKSDDESKKNTFEVSNLKNICDSESSADESEELTKSTTKKNYKSVEKKMTGREALEQRREIIAESQKMVRESKVSLPYHRPRQHTLHEFLKRRSLINDAIKTSPNTSTSIAIKMSTKHLKISAQQLEQREKEIEKFYKSDSEDEALDKKQTETIEKTDEISKEIEEINNKEEQIKELRAILQETLPNSNQTSELTNDSEINETNEVNTNTTEIEDEKVTEDKDKSVDLKLEELKKLNPLISLKSNFQPKLSGNPNEFIDLGENMEKTKKITSLMQRFIMHNKKRLSETKNEISVVNVEKGIVNKETIIMVEDPEEEPVKKIQIPGIKMKKLRIELEEQITKKRLEEWKKRQENVIDEEEKIYSNEKSDCEEALDKILDDETELTDSDSPSESEEDPEDEEEEDIKIVEKPQMKSAFVDDEAEVSDEEENEYESCQESENDEQESENDEQEFENDEQELENELPTKKTLRRIVQAFTEDSDEETINEAKTTDDLVSQTPQKTNSWEENDEEIPVYQQQSEKTPCKFATQSKNDPTTFLSPIIHLTALQGMNSTTKSLQDSPSIDSFLPAEPSPLRSKLIKTKLFANQGSAEDLNDLENLCSGKFTATNTKNDNLSSQENNLLSVCSGKFPDLTQSLTDLVKPTELTIEKETPLKSVKMTIVSSSDDSEDEDITNNKDLKKKKTRKYIIDDISITDEESDEEKEDFDDERNVDYDSEENEIEMIQDDETIKKAREFFENEAELSESDWGSADEDEKDLDDFEFEDGDADKINERKVQRELERMHVRNILDEDQREVRLLQEILLKDGEMHGSGRERKFRWKNADSMTWNTENEGQKEEEEEDREELESELSWRKMRHERETFLQKLKMKQNNDVINETAIKDSQVLQLGQAVLEKCQKTIEQSTVFSNTDDITLPFNLVNKRGSFLARSEQFLSRLAELTNTTESLNGPKNSKNFVFTTVEKTETIVGEKRKAEEGTPKHFKKLRIADTSPSMPKAKKKLSLL